MSIHLPPSCVGRPEWKTGGTDLSVRHKTFKTQPTDHLKHIQGNQRKWDGDENCPVTSKRGKAKKYSCPCGDICKIVVNAVKELRDQRH